MKEAVVLRSLKEEPGDKTSLSTAGEITGQKGGPREESVAMNRPVFCCLPFQQAAQRRKNLRRGKEAAAGSMKKRFT